MCIDLLEQQHLLLTHGTGFNLPSTDHIRVVFLAPVEVLSDAITRLGEFLDDLQAVSPRAKTARDLNPHGLTLPLGKRSGWWP